ncbi:D-sedoheptulose-7-phosphate isomerase [Geosporobacter ferrireducens]|uniref:SIS domain-containing protein n=1 Tax=Geosporobacter ferrireducens TaxID=1424294 RepID=A0A1D8GI35_9FIRM|nr:SIS domain-containing protein [Geosporobacter ferrireducens]AOT70568.1 hypothetical protein Gferi_13895 [Geosporobacter ferrireducens]
MYNYLKIYQQYRKDLILQIQKIKNDELIKIVEAIYNCYMNDKGIYIVGNGGSAATASHLACDLAKIADKFGKGLRAICLNDSSAILTAIANDIDYKMIFSDQMSRVSQGGDILIVLTASGNSSNIIEAVKFAQENNIYSIGLLGFDGGEVLEKLDNYILIDNYNYGVVEDVHLSICHMISLMLKCYFVNSKGNTFALSLT